MADAADVLDAIAAAATKALYPSSSSATTSSVGSVVKVMRGTPFAKQLDADLRSGVVNVTVNERAQVGRTTTRFPMEWQNGSIAIPGLNAEVTGNTLTLAGTLVPGQGILIIVDGQPYAYQFQANDTIASAASALATAVQIDRQATANNNSIYIPNARKITARAVIQGTVTRPVRQQTIGIMIKVFAPGFAIRDAVAAAIDVKLALLPRLELADGTMGMLRYSGTSYDDLPQKALTFVRTLLYQVEYSTTQSMDETTIGVVEAVIAPGAPGGFPGPITIATDEGPPIAPLPSDLNVLMIGGNICTDQFGNPEVLL